MPLQPVTLFHRLSAVRWELESALRELNAVQNGRYVDTDAQLPELQAELQQAVHHLTLTLDYLARSRTSRTGRVLRLVKPR